jgi:hypothetical protein
VIHQSCACISSFCQCAVSFRFGAWFFFADGF